MTKDLDDMIEWVKNRPIYYDRDAKPITLERFVELCNDMEYVLVAHDKIGEIWVVTVWTGIDINTSFSQYDPEVPHVPLMFETQVSDEYPGMDRRYPNIESARKGHERLVERQYRQARTEEIDE